MVLMQLQPVVVARRDARRVGASGRGRGGDEVGGGRGSPHGGGGRRRATKKPRRTETRGWVKRNADEADGVWEVSEGRNADGQAKGFLGVPLNEGRRQTRTRASEALRMGAVASWPFAPEY